MTIYDDLLPVTKEIMSEFKQGDINLKKITPGTGPAHNPGSSTSESIPLDATVSGVSYKYVSQGFATSSDLMVTSSVVSGVNVSEKDFIEINNIDYKIIKDMSLPASDIKLIWKFIVRKGG